MKTTEEDHQYARQIVMDMKIAGIIDAYSKKYGVSLDVAANDFYSSEMSRLIENRVADLHCRSNLYLAGEVWDELHEMH